MPDERRYGEDEVAEIFEAAAAAGPDAGAGALSPAQGLTLAELQAIGREAGLAPERIAEAASALDLRRDAWRRSDFGLPVSVGRTVDLPRAPTDREWEMLVAELRETFGARGRVGANGGIREWNNGNLHAYVEPTTDGHRLRLGTTKSDGAFFSRMGVFGLLAALVFVVLLALTGELADDLVIPLLFAAMGGGALGYNTLRLPSWAAEREAQMERVAARARALLSADPEPARALPAGGGGADEAG